MPEFVVDLGFVRAEESGGNFRPEAGGEALAEALDGDVEGIS